MRWGIFWRKLLFPLKDVGKIVNVACLLHNFIIDEKNAADHMADSVFYGSFDIIEEDSLVMSQGSATSQRITEPPVALVTDNGAQRRGRPPADDERGMILRQTLTFELGRRGKHRFVGHRTKVNQEGNIYMLY